ncbi:transposase [Fischerella thermalis]|uniref:transposase n=1 Tax=Fischerella thermalis TaxID=372787 RepID=UPI0019FE2A37|nr:transposase [Fischerella thermalis]MBF1990830.1 transposase [Fischerella thermalis M58_A2018_009]MBF2061276.1 transposase [Fischerella thermalis M66_A2018_004]
MSEQRTEYDNPWKEIIEDFFPNFLEFFFPTAHAVIDWTKPYEFLDTELQQLEPDAEVGKRLVDKVAKVYLLNGEEAWVLTHIEVQSQYEKDFPTRIYIYNYRLFDRHKKRVISLAVLADEERNWRPNKYEYSLGGCSVSLEFPIVKLLDYEAQWQTLEQTTNPFGIVVMAHLRTKATNQNPESRLDWKLRLVRMLFEKGYDREEIIRLFRFIDWIMSLPEELANNFKTELRNDEEAGRMRYVTSIERLAKQEGREEGREEGRVETARESIVEVLEVRFGEIPNPILEKINGISDVSLLKTIHRQAIAIPSLDAFSELIDEISL